MILIAILILISIACLLFLINFIKRSKTYKYYLKKPGPLSGMEAATYMMKREGFDAKFLIFNGTHINPFYGNFYLPDKNAFVMKREIMDGRNMMAFCIGCQLASSALRYRNGDICSDIAVSFGNEYALRYVYNKEELEKLDDSYIVEAKATIE